MPAPPPRAPVRCCGTVHDARGRDPLDAAPPPRGRRSSVVDDDELKSRRRAARRRRGRSRSAARRDGQDERDERSRSSGGTAASGPTPHAATGPVRARRGEPRRASPTAMVAPDAHTPVEPIEPAQVDDATVRSPGSWSSCSGSPARRRSCVADDGCTMQRPARGHRERGMRRVAATHPRMRPRRGPGDAGAGEAGGRRLLSERPSTAPRPPTRGCGIRARDRDRASARCPRSSRPSERAAFS